MTYWSSKKEDILFEFGEWNERLKGIKSFQEFKELQKDVKKEELFFITKKTGKEAYSFSERYENVHYLLDDGFSTGKSKVNNLHRVLCIKGHIEGKRKKEMHLLKSNYFPIYFNDNLYSFSNNLKGNEGIFLLSNEEVPSYDEMMFSPREKYKNHTFYTFKTAVMEAILYTKNENSLMNIHFYPYNKGEEEIQNSFLLSLENKKGIVSAKNSKQLLLFEYDLTFKKLTKYNEYEQSKVVNVYKWIDENKMTKDDLIYFKSRELSIKYPFNVEVKINKDVEQKIKLFSFIEECFFLLNKVVPLKNIMTDEKRIIRFLKVEFKNMNVTGRYKPFYQIIQMNPILGFSDHQTFAHEFGHHLSNCITSSWGSTELKNGEPKEKAKLLRNKIIDWVLENSLMLKEQLKSEPRKKGWLMEREEIFARAFASYVCYKGGNPILFENNNKIWVIEIKEGIKRKILPEYYLEEIEQLDKFFQELIDCFIKN